MNLHDLARQAASRHGSAESARAWMLAQIESHKPLHDQLTNSLIGMACVEAWHAARHQTRDHCKRGPAARATAAADFAIAASATLLDSWMVGDKPLGDCTATDLREAATWERQLAGGHIRNAVFYERLAALCGRGQVRGKVGAERAAGIRDAIYRATTGDEAAA